MLNTNSNNFLKSSNEKLFGWYFFATRDDVDQNKIGDKTTQNVSTILVTQSL
jgi:hypothetical protein